MALRSLLKRGELLVAPGIYDGISLRVAEKVGFRAMYMTGYGTVASHLGLPDAGLAGYGEMVDRVRTFSRLSSVPLICDGDTGYGGLLNVAHTVQGYEHAGAAAIQLEDQEFPKKCGHTPGRRVIPLAEAAAKIKVAADARDSSDFLILARTDARTTYGLDEALRRAEAYARAGADILFVESPESEAEMEAICKALGGDVPLMVNVVEGGKTPVLPAARYAEMGYQLAIYPATAFLAAGRGIESVYGHLKATGTSVGVEHELTDFMAFSRTMGFERVWAFDKAHADVAQGTDGPKE